MPPRRRVLLTGCCNEQTLHTLQRICEFQALLDTEHTQRRSQGVSGMSASRHHGCTDDFGHRPASARVEDVRIPLTGHDELARVAAAGGHALIAQAQDDQGRGVIFAAHWVRHAHAPRRDRSRCTDAPRHNVATDVQEDAADTTTTRACRGHRLIDNESFRRGVESDACVAHARRRSPCLVDLYNPPACTTTCPTQRPRGRSTPGLLSVRPQARQLAGSAAERATGLYAANFTCGQNAQQLRRTLHRTRGPI